MHRSDLEPNIPHELSSSDTTSLGEFTLSENITALVQIKSDYIARYAQEKINLTTALVEQKWHNRHQIHPYRVKEEIYGAVISEIVHNQPHLKQWVLTRLEEVYQEIRIKEAETLSRTRALAENSYKTPNL